MCSIITENDDVNSYVLCALTYILSSTFHITDEMEYVHIGTESNGNLCHLSVQYEHVHAILNKLCLIDLSDSVNAPLIFVNWAGMEWILKLIFFSAK